MLRPLVLGTLAPPLPLVLGCPCPVILEAWAVRYQSGRALRRGGELCQQPLCCRRTGLDRLERQEVPMAMWRLVNGSHSLEGADKAAKDAIWPAQSRLCRQQYTRSPSCSRGRLPAD